VRYEDSNYYKLEVALKRFEAFLVAKLGRTAVDRLKGALFTGLFFGGCGFLFAALLADGMLDWAIGWVDMQRPEIGVLRSATVGASLGAVLGFIAVVLWPDLAEEEAHQPEMSEEASDALVWGFLLLFGLLGGSAMVWYGLTDVFTDARVPMGIPSLIVGALVLGISTVAVLGVLAGAVGSLVGAVLDRLRRK